MTEQDADDAEVEDGSDDGVAESADVSGADQPSEAGEPTADIDDIAEEPEADFDEALDDVLGEGVADELETDGIEPDDELVEHVAAADAEALAVELGALRTKVQTLESDLAERASEVEDLESRLARKQADFQNYKKRQAERLEEEKERATEDLVTRLLDVRDNLQRALDQDEGADIRGGVESTLRQLDEEFERENVERIEPDPGTETDPHRHEVLMRVESDRPAGTVADVHRPGYEMAGKVIRAAQVTVSEGADEDGDAEETGDGDDDGA